MDLRHHPEARAEFADAVEEYEDDYPGRGVRFRDAVGREFRRIGTVPHTFPTWGRRKDVRQVVVPNFPYKVIFRVEDEAAVIYAVAHDKRRPGYWQKRLKK